MHKHATVSAWQREHDGTYLAELEGYKLEVRWHPEAPGKKRGFTWTAEPESGGGEKLACPPEGIFEEMEHAMADAELAARRGSAA